MATAMLRGHALASVAAMTSARRVGQAVISSSVRAVPGGHHAMLAGTRGAAPAVSAIRDLATDAASADASVRDANEGTIASLFVNLGAEAPPLEARFGELKQKIMKDHGLTPAIAEEAWARLTDSLDELTKELDAMEDRSEIIPVIEFDDIAERGAFSEEQEAEVKRAGCVVLRNVVDRATVETWKQQVIEYIEANPTVLGYPQDNPQVYELYWTKPQVEARQHPRTYLSQTLLNKLWLPDGLDKSPDRPIDAHAVSYCDRLRIRDPGDATFALGEHVDGGGIERWEDEAYRTAFKSILSGDWESHNPYDAAARQNMKMDLYDTPNQCTAFRTFQGWMALSDVAPGEGTLRLHPRIVEATAHFILRPFLSDVGETDFPGAVPGTAQEITNRWHETLVSQMVSVPRVAPGDMVYWHCDGVHSVEAKHGGKGDSSVFYIPATPGCKLNSTNLKLQADNFRAGKTPPDFPQNHSEVTFTGRATEEDLTPLGRRMMGLDPWLGADESDPLTAAGGSTSGKVLEESAAVLRE